MSLRNFGGWFFSLFFIQAGVALEGNSGLEIQQGKPEIRRTELSDFSVQELTLPQEIGQSLSVGVLLNGTSYILKLQPHSIRAEGFRLLVQGEDGELRDVEPPAPKTVRNQPTASTAPPTDCRPNW